MMTRFGRFELDRDCRELRLEGAPIALQPQVFSLLCYLVRNRERVVSKEELLEQLWPNTFVTDSSLQKAVSLARTALRQGGADDAIRTLPRQGYRFVAEVEVVEGSPLSLPTGRIAQEEPTEKQLEVSLTQSLKEHIAAGDRDQAAQAAIRLGWIALTRLELSAARGWAVRAERLLGPETRTHEWGLVHSMYARVALFTGESDECLQRAEKALEIGRELGDPDIEVLGLIDCGHASLAMGKVNACVQHHDEAAALAMSGVLNPELTGIVYCSVIWACQNRGDWKRANEWTASYTRWCEANSTSYYPGLCRLHRAEIYWTQGNLPAAKEEIADVASLLDRAAPWAAGEAHRIQGQILLDSGDQAGAEAEFRRTYEYGWEPQPGYAWLLFSQGHLDRALAGLRRAIVSSSWGMIERRTFLRVEEVCLALACGREDVAREAIEIVRKARGDRGTSLSLQAEADRAEGELALHEERFEDAVSHLRASRDAWLKVGSPPNAARARLRLAQAFEALGDDEAAAVEREAMRSTFLPMGVSLELA